MLVSWIGLTMVLVVALMIGARVIEKRLWTSRWRLSFSQWRFMFPGYREAAAMKDIADRLKTCSDEQEQRIDDLEFHYQAYVKLYHRVYHEVDGLEAQVKDLNTVLEWNRDKMAIRNKEYGDMQQKLEDAKQEVLIQMGYAHEARERFNVSEDIRRDLHAELRKRATLIRKLRGNLPRKRKK